MCVPSTDALRRSRSIGKRLREISKPFGLVARLQSPIEFNAIDGQPVDMALASDGARHPEAVRRWCSMNRARHEPLFIGAKPR